jgi:hypothetical protein
MILGNVAEDKQQLRYPDTKADDQLLMENKGHTK